MAGGDRAAAVGDSEGGLGEPGNPNPGCRKGTRGAGSGRAAQGTALAAQGSPGAVGLVKPGSSAGLRKGQERDFTGNEVSEHGFCFLHLCESP